MDFSHFLFQCMAEKLSEDSLFHIFASGHQEAQRFSLKTNFRSLQRVQFSPQWRTTEASEEHWDFNTALLARHRIFCFQMWLSNSYCSTALRFLLRIRCTHVPHICGEATGKESCLLVFITINFLWINRQCLLQFSWQSQDCFQHVSAGNCFLKNMLCVTWCC